MDCSNSKRKKNLKIVPRFMSLHRYLCCHSVLRIREFSRRRPDFQLRRAEHQMASAERIESVQQLEVPDQQHHRRRVGASYQKRGRY